MAYVATEAAGDAALIAMACDQVVIQRDATLGGLRGRNLFRPTSLTGPPDHSRAFGPAKSRSWSLVAALVDPRLAVFRYTHSGTGLVEYFCPEEAESQPDADQWVKGEEIHKPREPLALTALRAVELGLARHAVADFSEFKQLYNLEGEMAVARTGWADRLIEALAMPGVALLLLFVGVAALYAELHAPGIGVGGFHRRALLLVVLWSKYLDGTAGWLEVLLFAAGIVCVLLEIFVLPGTAIFGLGGGLLIIASLVLASQTFVLPHNEYQFRQFSRHAAGAVGRGGRGGHRGSVMPVLPRTTPFGHMA